MTTWLLTQILIQLVFDDPRMKGLLGANGSVFSFEHLRSINSTVLDEENHHSNLDECSWKIRSLIRFILELLYIFGRNHQSIAH